MTQPAMVPAVDSTLRLPVGSVAGRTAGHWGMVCLIASEAALFAYLLFAYAYSAVQLGPGWLPATPSLRLALPNTAALLLSSVAVAYADRSARRGHRAGTVLGFALAIVLGVIFVGVQILEWRAKPFTPTSNSYGSIYFLTTGFHMAHVAAGLAMLVAVLIWTALGYFDRLRRAPLAIVGLYWHFVDLVWLAVFFTYYITPRIA